jgi:hypothetical protein
MRPLLLSGGPAVGKSTCGRLLAGSRERAAFIDVDDIRQLVVAGDATLWSGAEGERQLLLAARNAAALGRNFTADGFDVVVADFEISFDAAVRRAATRRVYLTDDEFELLHRMIETPPEADVILRVDEFTVQQQTHAIAELWKRP